MNNMNENELRHWIVKHHIQARSIEQFWISFHSYKKESLAEFEHYFELFDEQHLDIEIQQIALMLSSPPEYADVHIVTYIPIVYRTKTIGLYQLLFTLNGLVYDDYFTLYEYLRC